MNFNENDVVTLSDNSEYLIIKKINFNNSQYLYLTKIDDGDCAIVKVVQQNGITGLSKLDNDEYINILMKLNETI